MSSSHFSHFSILAVLLFEIVGRIKTLKYLRFQYPNPGMQATADKPCEISPGTAAAAPDPSCSDLRGGGMKKRVGDILQVNVGVPLWGVLMPGVVSFIGVYFYEPAYREHLKYSKATPCVRWRPA